MRVLPIRPAWAPTPARRTACRCAAGRAAEWSEAARTVGTSGWFGGTTPRASAPLILNSFHALGVSAAIAPCEARAPVLSSGPAAALSYIREALPHNGCYQLNRVTLSTVLDRLIQRLLF
jgi:hypothetical protein